MRAAAEADAGYAVKAAHAGYAYDDDDGKGTTKKSSSSSGDPDDDGMIDTIVIISVVIPIVRTRSCRTRR